VVGYIALFIALGGTAYALGANSVKSKHIRDGHVRTVDVANDTTANALTGTDVAADSLHGADILEEDLFNDNSLDFEDIDVASLQGFDPSAVGPRVYARVETTGDVTEADSKALTDAQVSTVGGTVVCFDPGFDVHTIIGSVETTAPVDRFVITFNQGGPPCAAGDDAIAMVYDVSAAALASAPFYVEMN
jgi:hypothetical protein